MDYYHKYIKYKNKYISFKKQLGGFKFELYSKDFKNGDHLPIKYSCKGESIQPELFWRNVPSKTKSFALIMEDPDAPKGTFIHWFVYNIPKNVNMITKDHNYPVTENSANEKNFHPACPPSGEHRYIFKLYALDRYLTKNLNRNQILDKINKYTIGKTELQTYFGNK